MNINSKLCSSISREYTNIVKNLEKLEEKSNRIIRRKLQNLKQIFKKKVDKEFNEQESQIFKLIKQIKISLVYLNDIKTELEDAKFCYPLKSSKRDGLIENEVQEKFESKLIYLVSNITRSLTMRLSDVITHYQKFKRYVNDYQKKSNKQPQFGGDNLENSGRICCSFIIKRTRQKKQGIFADFRNKRIYLGGDGKERNH